MAQIKNAPPFLYFMEKAARRFKPVGPICLFSGSNTDGPLPVRCK